MKSKKEKKTESERRVGEFYYEEVFEAFKREKVEYLIAGGMAVNLYGVPRFTKDLGILINPSRPNLARLARALKALGYRPKVPVSLEAFLDKRNWARWKREKGMMAFNLFHPEKHFEQIDLLIGIPPSFSQAKRRQETTYAKQTPLPLVGIDDLIKMKLRAGRERDLADVESLKKVKTLRDGA